MPAYNEEMSIADVIRGCQRYVDKVVVVDDGEGVGLALDFSPLEPNFENY